MKNLKVLPYIKPLSVIPLFLIYFSAETSNTVHLILILIAFIYMLISSYMELSKKKTIPKIIAIPFNLIFIAFILPFFYGFITAFPSKINIGNDYAILYFLILSSCLFAIFTCVREMVVSFKKVS